jgi:hypothetical protein
MDQLPNKFRLHVTRRDTEFGCPAKKFVFPKSCAVERPAERWLKKIDPSLHVAAGYDTLEITTGPDKLSGVLVAKYRAVDKQRMSDFTSANDAMQVQSPTSFTFVREV